MIKSMTGFASLTRDDEAAAIAVTVKGVNHRFLDLQLRSPAALAAIEARLRAVVQRYVARGRVELSISLQSRKTAAVDVDVNEAVIEGIASALDRARERGLVSGTLSPGDILRFPQAVTIRERADEGGIDERLGGAVESAVAAALEEFDRMRAKEGEHLRADLDRRRAQLGALFEQAAAKAADGEEALRARLTERVKDLRTDPSVDEAAIAQEIVRFANRSDLTEETVRFRGHLEHWRALSDSEEPCGRKLDFLLQEMNREVNTLGSKAEGAGVPELVVALKAELEKMREQVQNVE
jgi:uncharacterized protein (TIGR00255 family)